MLHQQMHRGGQLMIAFRGDRGHIQRMIACAGAWQMVLTCSCVCPSVVQIPIKSCRDVCFSNGGQYFAAINGITLSIYNTYTCECVGNLRGHNGKVGREYPNSPQMALRLVYA